jgi:hypothetical protein
MTYVERALTRHRVIRLAAVLLAGGPLILCSASIKAADQAQQQEPAKAQDSSKPEEEIEGDKKAAAEAKRRAIEEYEEAEESLAVTAGAPECVWTGRRIVSLLWRDDIDTARRFMELYEHFTCSPKHLKLAFRCVIKQGPIDPKAAEELATRVHDCWIAPEKPTTAASRATGSTTKGGTIPK